jgi:hypothetical protein
MSEDNFHAEEEKLVAGDLIPGQTGRLNAGRNIT